MDEILKKLAAPFPAEQISWKPQAISKDGKRALAVAYLDARDVAERLDEVCGLGWQFYWEADGDDVHGTLAIHTADGWVERSDVGEPGEGEMGKSRKAAVSDALKRCAVLFGVGRYLYRLPAEWVDYDPDARRLAKVPQLPAWALPETEAAEAAPRPVEQAPAQAPKGSNGAPALARGSQSHALSKPAVIRASGWNDMLMALQENAEIAGYYSTKDGKETNRFHVARACAKLGYGLVTDENIGEVYEALVEHAKAHLDAPEEDA